VAICLARVAQWTMALKAHAIIIGYMSGAAG